MTAAAVGVGVGVVGLEGLTWSSHPDGRDARARRWVHRVLHGLAVELDAITRAHDAVTVLRASLDHADAPCGDLAAALRRVAGLAVPAHDSTDLTDHLTAHELAAAAGQLHRAHTHRRVATSLLRRLADLDHLGLVDRDQLPDLLDRDQLPDLLDRAATELRAAGDALVTADRHLIAALNDHDTRR